MLCTLRDHGYWCVNEMRRRDRIAAATGLSDIHLLPKWLSVLYLLVKEKGLLSQEHIAPRISRLRTEISPC